MQVHQAITGAFNGPGGTAVGIGAGGAEPLHPKVMYCTVLYWNGMDWNVMEWNGM